MADDKPLNLSTYESGPFRRFSNPYTQAALDSALIEMSPDDPVVVVAHHVYNDDGTQVENVTKLSAVARLPNGGLSVMVGAYKDWSKGDKGVEGKIVWRPRDLW
jgi:hypothetical protein